MSVLKSIMINHFQMKEKRGWDKTFWFFDIHATIIKPNYKFGDIPTEFYPNALKTLQYMSTKEDICMILYTCSHPHEIVQYEELFKNNGINFEFVNKNPMVKTDLNGYGCYEDKPYINVLFDDKAGFTGDTDWQGVLDLLKHKYENLDVELNEDDVDQLYAEIDNEGLGNWIQNYSNSWEGKEYELTVLLQNARNSFNNLEKYLINKNAME